MQTLFEGIILGLSITAPIGPTNVEVIKKGLIQGWKAASLFSIGVLVALIIYLLIVMIGMSILLKSQIFNKALLMIGVIILFYLAFNSINDFILIKELDFYKTNHKNKNFIEGIILTISNPAVLVLWSGILGADFAVTSTNLTDRILLSFGIIVGVTVFFIFLIALIHHGKKIITQKFYRYISLIAGIILFYFGLKFAIQLFK